VQQKLSSLDCLIAGISDICDKQYSGDSGQILAGDTRRAGLVLKVYNTGGKDVVQKLFGRRKDLRYWLDRLGPIKILVVIAAVFGGTKYRVLDKFGWVRAKSPAKVSKL
jgi:hypothetical protein